MLFLGFHFRWADGVTLSLPLPPAFPTLPAAGGDAVHVSRCIHSFFCSNQLIIRFCIPATKTQTKTNLNLQKTCRSSIENTHVRFTQIL